MKIKPLSSGLGLCLLASVAALIAQQPPAAPKLELAIELHAEVGKPDEVGVVAGGTRRVVPILGGTFTLLPRGVVGMLR
jgi:hypothetical protein